MSDIYEKVMEMARRRGFTWPTSECYGAVAGFIDYGPLGAMMKRRIENLWRDFFVIREGYYEIECPTVGAEAMAPSNVSAACSVPPSSRRMR